MLAITLFSSYSSIVWAIVLAVLFYLNYQKKAKNRQMRNDPPTPAIRLPLLGHMYLLAKYPENPWDGFDAIRKRYGDIVYLRLGAYDFLLVSSLKHIKEVLIIKPDQFLNRPHFERYKCIFGGDQENALAFSDWSELQKQRRSLAKASTIPRYGTKLFEHLDGCINDELLCLHAKLNEQSDVITLHKLDILVSTFNIFSMYLCSQRFDYENPEMRKGIHGYDEIFFDINQAYPFDFMPWLCNFSFVKRQMDELRTLCNRVRDFVEMEMILPRHNELKNRVDELPETLEKCTDYLEYNLMTHYRDPVGYDWESFLYQIGDLIGGNSAVGSLVYRVLGHLALNPQCQDRIYEEAVQTLEHFNALNGEHEQTIRLRHRNLMVYTEASIMEALRLASSPIVPHVASQNTTIGGYYVKKNTYVMFNSYNLNLSEEHHFEPRTFEPARFLAPKSEGPTGDAKIDELEEPLLDDPMPNEPMPSKSKAMKRPFVRSYRPIEFLKYQVLKPEHYFPFSWGKRSCLGYKLVQLITFGTVANLMLRYTVRPVQGGYTKLEKQLQSKGTLALSVDDCYDLILMPRQANAL